VKLRKSASIMAQSSDFTLTVHGQSGVWDGFGMIVLGVLTLSIASRDLRLLIIGAFLLLLGLLSALMALPRMGKPILTLSEKGFNTPEFGLIPWSAVQGIDKTVPTARGIKMSPVLIFYVPDLKKYKDQFHGIRRQLHPKKRIHITLRRSDVTPEIVLSVSRRLWTKLTGRDHFWNPYVPDEVNEAQRRIWERMRHEREQLDDISKAVEEGDEYKVAYLLRRAELNKTTYQSDKAIIDADRRKNSKLSNYLVAISLLFLVTYVMIVIMQFFR